MYNSIPGYYNACKWCDEQKVELGDFIYWQTK